MTGPKTGGRSAAVSNSAAGRTLAELEDQLAALTRQMQEHTRKLKLATEAAAYCGDYRPDECPVCATHFEVNELTERLKLTTGQATPEHTELVRDYETLQARISELKLRSDALINLDKKIEQNTVELSNMLREIRLLLHTEENVTPLEVLVESQLEGTRVAIRVVRDQLESQQTLRSNRDRELKGLRSELRFQYCRREEERIGQRLITDLEPIRNRQREFVGLIETVTEIQGRLQEIFNQELDKTLPVISRRMTDVYQRLTKQMSFEKVYVERDTSKPERTLLVRVGSDRTSGRSYEPEKVLNGQAMNALRLVPYFVFADFKAEALELDLLLIDDPSQSFDTSRVELLLAELAKVSSHAQLIVASHEVDRFRCHIPQFFDSSQVKILMVTNLFDPIGGPSIDSEQ